MDHNATTPLRAEVREAMQPYLDETFGNASSIHAFGRTAAKGINQARRQVAAALGCQPDDGGRTERRRPQLHAAPQHSLGRGAGGDTGVDGGARKSVRERNMPTEEQIREALRPVVDPEIGVSVVDLGMIREVAVEGDEVEIKMVLTAPFCPLADMITEQVRQAAAAVPGVKEAKVNLLQERWDPSWIKR